MSWSRSSRRLRSSRRGPRDDPPRSARRADLPRCHEPWNASADRGRWSSVHRLMCAPPSKSSRPTTRPTCAAMIRALGARDDPPVSLERLRRLRSSSFRSRARSRTGLHRRDARRIKSSVSRRARRAGALPSVAEKLNVIARGHANNEQSTRRRNLRAARCRVGRSVLRKGSEKACLAPLSRAPGTRSERTEGSDGGPYRPRSPRNSANG